MRRVPTSPPPSRFKRPRQRQRHKGCNCTKCRSRREGEAAYQLEEYEGLEAEAAAISTIPRPGAFYKIQYQKGGLLTTAGRAYGLGAGSERLKMAQLINNHPKNRKFWIRPYNNYTRRYFPKGVISFSPRFACSFAVQQAARGEAPRGRCFAHVWIPPRPRPRRSRHRMPKRGRYIPQGSIDLQYRRWLRSGGFFHVVGSIRYGDRKGFYALVRRALNYAVMEKGGDPDAITSRDVIDFATVVTEHIRNAPWKRTSGSSAVKKIAKAFLPRWSCETRQPGGGKGRCYGKIFLPVPPAGLIRNILRRNRYR